MPHRMKPCESVVEWLPGTGEHLRTDAQLIVTCKGTVSCQVGFIHKKTLFKSNMVTDLTLLQGNTLENMAKVTDPG